FANSEIEARVKSSTGWNSVTYLGQVGRKEIAELLASSKVAAVTFLPAPNHVESQPNKMFEYMSASLPVIGSNFPLWKEIIEGNHCGVCVDPSSPAEMSSTLDSLLCDHQRLKSMAENARVAIQEKYNWE
ncbi:glycosyltransferase, partial [Vibrio anguillarum]|nr:glycosyltransferase [Vibrio anguillarum]